MPVYIANANITLKLLTIVEAENKEDALKIISQRDIETLTILKVTNSKKSWVYYSPNGEINPNSILIE